MFFLCSVFGRGQSYRYPYQNILRLDLRVLSAI